MSVFQREVGVWPSEALKGVVFVPFTTRALFGSVKGPSVHFIVYFSGNTFTLLHLHYHPHSTL